jgi:hypothetical protein
MAGKSRAFEPAQSIEVEGNKGGSYIRIARTSKEDVVRLAVGHDCVTSCDIEISVFALAGVTLPPRPRHTVMPGCCEMVHRVLEKLQATTPVVVPEPEPEYVAEF